MQPITAYLCLLAAIVFEVSGTLLLPASQNFTNAKATISIVSIRCLLLFFVNRCERYSYCDNVCYLEWIRNFYFGPCILFCFQSISQFLVCDWISSIVIGVVLVNMNITLPE